MDDGSVHFHFLLSFSFPSLGESAKYVGEGFVSLKKQTKEQFFVTEIVSSQSLQYPFCFESHFIRKREKEVLLEHVRSLDAPQPSSPATEILHQEMDSSRCKRSNISDEGGLCRRKKKKEKRTTQQTHLLRSFILASFDMHNFTMTLWIEILMPLSCAEMLLFVLRQSTSLQELRQSIRLPKQASPSACRIFNILREEKRTETELPNNACA